MIQRRPANTRWHGKKDWIETHRTFSFPPYLDPLFLNYSSLETINDDRVQPNSHVAEHLHINMEIFGYVVEGSCYHTDNLGNTRNIPAGAVQRMSAGRGIRHTEGNSTASPNRYLQLWIRPNVLDVEPVHSWYQFTRNDKLNKFCDITAVLPINADARLLAGIFTNSYSYTINSNRRYYLYVVNGTGTINGIAFADGDGFAFSQEQIINITINTESELILFDLP